jgi:hypothetical protein
LDFFDFFDFFDFLVDFDLRLPLLPPSHQQLGGAGESPHERPLLPAP